MIVLSNTTAQTLQPGQSITFDDIVVRRGCGECHRKNSSSVKMRSNGIYELHFSGNIDGATADAPAQLALTLGGSPLLETTMKSSVTGVNNVATSTAVSNCCGDYDRVSVTNTGTIAITVDANTSFVVHKSNNC